MTSKKIVWVSGLILDYSLSKTTQFEILKNLSKRGHHTILFGMRSRQTMRTKTTKDNYGPGCFGSLRFFFVPIRYFPVIAPAINALVMAFLLPAYIAVSNPDFVIMSPEISIISSIPSLFVSKIRKTKLILDIRSTPVESVGFRGSAMAFWFDVSILVAKRFFSGITIITPMMKREISEKFSINPQKIGVWSSGVSTSLFNPDVWDKQGASLRTELCLSGKFVVLYHGWFAASRGITETVEAIRVLSQRSPDIMFFLLGTGPSASELKSLIKKKKVENSVIIHDSVEYAHVPKYIAMCDVSIVPLPDTIEWRFQSSLKLLEYLAMGKVVILTDIPAHRFVIGEEKCGIYISSTEPSEIAKAIGYARLNEKDLEKWGRIGREIVKKNFDWEMVAINLEKYLLSLE